MQNPNRFPEWIRMIAYWLLLVIRVVFFPFTKIAFILVIILLGFWAMVLNDQGQDMMFIFVSKSIFSSSYLVLFEIFLIFWSIAIWNSSRVLLEAANFRRLVAKQIDDKILKEEGISDLISTKKWVVASIDENYKKGINVMIRWLPRLLAMMPYMIFFIAYKQQAKYYNGAAHRWNYLLLIVVAIIQFLFLTYRRRIIKKSDSSEIRFEQKGLFEAIRASFMIINTILFIILSFVLFGYAFWAGHATPTFDGKPGLIIVAALTIYTLIGFALNHLINVIRVPVVTIFIILSIFLFARFNNNHSVEVLKSAADVDMLNKRNRLTDSAYATFWIREKVKERILNIKAGSDTQTVFIVAAEGGGIRNTYWTYKVLSHLQEINPNFYNRTFAATGVSGGCVGVGFYYNYKYYFDSLLKIKDSIRLAKAIDEVCGADYLSGVTYGLLFPDMLQRFLPMPVESWDRGKFLSNKFDDGFTHLLAGEDSRANYLSNNFLTMWSDTNLAYKRPALLFNTIFNENGLKAIYSPYRLSDTYYTGVMDILNETNRSIPMKEGMVSAARFPIIAPPGLLKHDVIDTSDKLNNELNGSTKYKEEKLGHISDGGGYENTSIHTALQTARLLLNQLKEEKITNVNVKIIYIGTGVSPLELQDKIPSDKGHYKKAAGISYEVAWLDGGVQTIFGWIKGAQNIVSRLDKRLSVLQFGLDLDPDQNDHSLPLGFYLSDSSRVRIANQAKNSCKESYKIFDTLR